ncbi:unnamed protein product, partial [Musa acuminata subsp. burmannicoides]
TSGWLPIRSAEPVVEKAALDPWARHRRHSQMHWRLATTTSGWFPIRSAEPVVEKAAAEKSPMPASRGSGCFLGNITSLFHILSVVLQSQNITARQHKIQFEEYQ